MNMFVSMRPKVEKYFTKEGKYLIIILTAITFKVTTKLKQLLPNKIKLDF